MNIYRVGGSVRDELLGRAVADRDYVVVGTTPEEMLAQGFRPVGREFPVFLHPATHEEYALARTERKQGRGHRGFTFHAAPDVTLEQDLARRDLTINAMARDAEGRLIDPYGGAADLERGVLRHVGPAFVEDPLRVLRVARFAARFGFTVAPETEALLERIAASGELATLTPERVWRELATALMEARPSRFFSLLHRCGALAQLLPEVDRAFPARSRRSARSDTESHMPLLRALDAAAAAGDALAVSYAVLAGDLGAPGAAKGRTNSARSLRLAAAVNRRLKTPAECSALALLLARHGAKLERARELRAAELLDLLLAVDALRRPARLEQLLRACVLVWSARTRRAEADFPPSAYLRSALQVLRSVNASAIAAKAAPRETLGKRLRAARLQALQQWLKRSG
ncbi:MAG TPA: multifunctional CCA addition/repair protein [Casimicrobiaceae bacterium]|nr:multifunctional CCA addition/repair protein [Casimicrobiaceae bacterium]